MTRARMHWRSLILELEGHANAGRMGEDIVCAAESMLTQALLQTLIDAEREKKVGLYWTGSPELGFLRIEAAPAEEHRSEIRACFVLVVTGLRMLEEKYPQYIKLEEVGKNGIV